MHYYQFNIGDYLSHTSHLSETEDLVYRRLLDWTYLHEKPIPLNIDEVARNIRMRTHCESIAIVLREFFICMDYGWISERVLKEVAKAGEKSRKASESAKIRWDANALRLQSNSNATQDTVPKTQNTKHKKAATEFAPPDGVSSEVWQEFTKHRKAKKASVTPLVIKGIAEQAEKAGWSLENALRETVVRGWQSFQADWVTGKNAPSGQSTLPKCL
tara:strand:- start:508 stop:1155 length:648 start_codon:yes stop_codon:yes gene_type:complete